MLYREPKLLKAKLKLRTDTSALAVSVLYREPKLLKVVPNCTRKTRDDRVSVLYREPKLLKEGTARLTNVQNSRFQCSTVSRNC